MERFEGCRARYRQVRSGGVGAFTADNFPVFDHMRPNVFVAADSNHGYKMIAVGREIARVLHGRALHAAAPVPLRALRDRRPAPGLEQPVPLELMAASHVVVGGGVNGLSVAWRLAERGADVLVLDKGRVGGGATGSAGGIVRNYYRAEAITELVRMSVEIFESEPDAYGFRQVGYLAAVPERQVDDLVAIREQHERAGYASELVVGAERCREYLTLDAGRTGRRRSRRSSTSAAAAGPTPCRRCATWPTARAAPARRSARAWRSSASSSATTASPRSRRARAGWSARRWSSRRGRGSPACGACSG